MIEIRLQSDGTKLILDPNTSVSFRKRHSAFDPGSVFAQYTLPFQLPVSGNERILGWQHQIESIKPPADVPVIFSNDGVDFFFGSIRHLSANRYFYNCQLVVSDNELNPESSLRDYFNDQIEYPYPASYTLRSVNDDGYPTYHYMLGSFTNIKDEFINKYGTDWVNEWAGGDVVTAPTPPATDRKPLNVQLYFFYVLRHLCGQLGYEARGDLFLDDELATLVVFNNWIFEYDNGFTVDEYRLVPDISISAFFEKITGLGIAIDIDNTRRVVSFDLVKNFINRTDIVDLTDKLEYDYQIDFKESLELQLNQSLSDGYASSVLRDIDGKDGGNVYDYPADILSPPVLENEFAFVNVEESHYKVTQQAPLETERYFNIPSYKFGTGEKAIDLPETLVTAIHPDYADALIPRCDFDWSDVDQESDFPLQLLFFRGMQQSKSSLTYPATCANNIVTTSSSPFYATSGNYTLFPAGENGVALKLFENWGESLLQVKILKQKFAFTMVDLVKLRMHPIVRLNSTHFVIYEMMVRFRGHDILDVEMSLSKLTVS
jgi:hypothetical protein